MKRELTQSTLAALAARLPKGTAPERVTLAADIWNEAGNLLEDRELVAKTAELAEHADGHDWQPLEAFLREALKHRKTTKAKQREKYREFLAWKATQAKGCAWTFNGKTVSACDLTPAQARKVADGWLAEHDASGLLNPHFQRADFLDWLEGDKGRNQSERGRKAVAAKKTKKRR